MQKRRLVLVSTLFVIIVLAFSCLAACDNVNTDNVKSVYELYVEKNPDYNGTQEQFLSDLLSGKLSNSDEGEKSVYELYTEEYPEYTGDEEQFLGDLLTGKLGNIGQSEKSVYELYKEAHPDYEGTESEWLEEILGLAIGKKPEYTVTFKLNETDEEPYLTVTVNEGGVPYFPHDTPTKTGYDFMYWGYDGYEWPYTYPITQDTVITAVWEEKRYNVTYHLDGGINDVFNPVVYTIEERASLSSPQKEYYVFDGWYSSDSFRVADKIDEIKLGSIGDIELYAKWTPIQYAIGYEGVDGATFEGDMVTSYTYETDGVSLPTVSKDHYEFVGWTTDESTKPQKNVVINGGSHGNIFYKANWKAVQYSVTYELNGGNNNQANKATYNADDFAEAEVIELLAPSKDTKENIKDSVVDHLSGMWTISSSFSTFDFDCWTDEYGNVVEEIRLGDGNVKVFAKWIENESAVSTRESLYLRDYDQGLVYIGLYPQHQVKEEDEPELFAALNNQLSDADMSDVKEDAITGIQQKDIVYNNKKYRKAKCFDSKYYRWFYGWFEFRPVAWAVVSISDDGVALLSCKTQVGVISFGGEGYWADCKARAYLNSMEYHYCDSDGYVKMDNYAGLGVIDQLFNEGQKAIIQTSHLDNSKVSEFEKNSGPSTDDKLFLFTYSEVHAYGYMSEKVKFTYNPYCFWTNKYSVKAEMLYQTWTRCLLSDTYNKGEKLLIMRRGYGDFVLGHDAAWHKDSSAPLVPAMRIKL